MSDKESNFIRFTKTTSYAELLKTYPPAETGLCQIFGEDPNCDFTGSHTKPCLGFAEGRLVDVMEYAVERPSFWQWGAGGTIEKVCNIAKVDSKTNERRQYLLRRREEALEMITAVDIELGKL